MSKTLISFLQESKKIKVDPEAERKEQERYLPPLKEHNRQLKLANKLLKKATGKQWAKENAAAFEKFFMYLEPHDFKERIYELIEQDMELRHNDAMYGSTQIAFEKDMNLKDFYAIYMNICYQIMKDREADLW